VKRNVLGVSDELLGREGAVSAEVAAAMAAGARERLRGNAAVAVTGIAGPDGGTPEKPVGLVYISVETPETATTERFQLPGDRDAVRARATALALHRLRRLLAQSGTDA
jgi:nicotinamide-nucleotide amidase